jgi:multicomponent Na+:H+ antiporter subunit G
MNAFVEPAIAVVSGVFLLAGAALALVAAIGVHRLPDTLARMHAATKPATLGVVLCALGAVLRLPDLSDVAKIAVVVVLQLVSAPIGAHVLGRAVRGK